MQNAWFWLGCQLSLLMGLFKSSIRVACETTLRGSFDRALYSFAHASRVPADQLDQWRKVPSWESEQFSTVWEEQMSDADGDTALQDSVIALSG